MNGRGPRATGPTRREGGFRRRPSGLRLIRVSERRLFSAARGRASTSKAISSTERGAAAARRRPPARGGRAAPSFRESRLGDRSAAIRLPNARRLAATVLRLCLPVSTRDAGRGSIRLALRSFPQLARPGGYVKLAPRGAATLLYVLAVDQGYAVLSPVCTHLGCIVNIQGAELVCPCHASAFDREGRVLRGPAQRPLRGCRRADAEGDLVSAGRRALKRLRWPFAPAPLDSRAREGHPRHDGRPSRGGVYDSPTSRFCG